MGDGVPERHCPDGCPGCTPTPIYESLMSFALFGMLWSQRRRFEGVPGTTFGLSLICLGIERFIAEFWRITPRVLGWMTAAQIFSIVAFIVGIALVFWMRSRPRPVATVLSAEVSSPSTGEQSSPPT